MKNKFIKIFYFIIIFIILFGCSQVKAAVTDLPETPSYWNKAEWKTQKEKYGIKINHYLTTQDNESALVINKNGNDKSGWIENIDNPRNTTAECILYINKYVQEKGYKEATDEIGNFEENYIKITENFMKTNISTFMKGDVENKYESENHYKYYNEIMKNATEFIKDTRRTAQNFKMGVALAQKEHGSEVTATNWQFKASDGKMVSFADSDDVKKKYSQEQIKKYIEEYGEEGIKALDKNIYNSWDWYLGGGSIEKLLEENTEKYVKNLTGLTVKELEEKQKLVGKNVGQRLYKIPNKDVDKDEKTNLDEIVNAADTFMNSVTENKIETNMVQNLSNTIYNILLVVGIIIAVIIGAVIGIMFVTGSVEQKADVKKLLIPYIVGCVVVFGSFVIWKIAVTMFSTL